MITALMHSPENPITVDTDSDESEDGSDDEGTVWNDEEDLVQIMPPQGRERLVEITDKEAGNPLVYTE